MIPLPRNFQELEAINGITTWNDFVSLWKSCGEIGAANNFVQIFQKPLGMFLDQMLSVLLLCTVLQISFTLSTTENAEEHFDEIASG